MFGEQHLACYELGLRLGQAHELFHQELNLDDASTSTVWRTIGSLIRQTVSKFAAYGLTEFSLVNPAVQGARQLARCAHNHPGLNGDPWITEEIVTTCRSSLSAIDHVIREALATKHASFGDAFELGKLAVTDANITEQLRAHGLTADDIRPQDPHSSASSAGCFSILWQHPSLADWNCLEVGLRHLQHEIHLKKNEVADRDEERNKWLYEQWAREDDKKILADLNRRPEWRHLTLTGMRSAREAYAAKHKLPTPKKSNRGRKQNKADRNSP